MSVDFSKLTTSRLPSEMVVECDAWGGSVTLKRVNGIERINAAIAAAGIERTGDELSYEMLEALSPLAAKTIVDGDSRPFDTEQGRIALLEEHTVALIELLPSVLKINGLLATDAALEESKKNSNVTNG